MGVGAGAVQARVKYLADRRQATQVLQPEAAVLSDSGVLLNDGEYASVAFGLSQGVNRLALQVSAENLSNTLRYWLEDAVTEQAIANLVPGREVRVSISAGRTLRLRAAGGSNDALSSFTVFAKYERV